MGKPVKEACVELLEKRIERDGIVEDADVLKVDGFLNHQIDTALIDHLNSRICMT